MSNWPINVSQHENAEKVQFVANQIIFCQSDPADKLYIITRGQVDVLRLNKRNGREIHVARLKEGQYLEKLGCGATPNAQPPFGQ